MKCCDSGGDSAEDVVYDSRSYNMLRVPNTVFLYVTINKRLISELVLLFLSEFFSKVISL